MNIEQMEEIQADSDELLKVLNELRAHFNNVESCEDPKDLLENLRCMYDSFEEGIELTTELIKRAKL